MNLVAAVLERNSWTCKLFCASSCGRYRFKSFGWAGSSDFRASGIGFRVGDFWLFGFGLAATVGVLWSYGSGVRS